MIVAAIILIALYFVLKGSASFSSSIVADTKLAQTVSATYYETADRVAGMFGIPPSVILAIITVESEGNPNPPPASAGEVGLMQVTPIALKQVNKVNGWSYSTEDLKQGEINIMVGTAYLSWLWKQTGSLELAVKAYNHALDHVMADHSEGQEYFNKVAAYDVEFRKIISGF